MAVDDKKKKELLEKAYEMGFEYEKKYKGCSQCTLAAVQDLLEIQDDATFKAASGFAGGGGITIEGPCGGFTGGVMVLSQLCGRERKNFDDPDRKVVPFSKIGAPDKEAIMQNKRILWSLRRGFTPSPRPACGID